MFSNTASNYLCEVYDPRGGFRFIQVNTKCILKFLPFGNYVRGVKIPKPFFGC